MSTHGSPSRLPPGMPPEERLQALRVELAGHDMTFFADVPYVYHCHHYNLFHDQTIDDALGEELSAEVRRKASHGAFYPFLENVMGAMNAETPAERTQLATQLFAAMGQGRLDLDAGPDGGWASGSFLHYGFSWREKYGSRVRRTFPVDAVAEGFAAATVELAHRLPFGSIAAREEECIATKHTGCRIRLTRQEPSTEPGAVVDRLAVAASIASDFGGLDEERIAQIASGLKAFMKPVVGDERGLVQAFNVFVTMHLANYYNESFYESVRLLEARQPGNVSLAEQLFAEAGTTCVFNTFGNLLLSPEWEGLVGPVPDSPEDIVSFCCAIARGLGFGRWSVHEFEKDKRLVLRAPSTYETPFYLTRYGKSERPRGYIFQGAGRAIATLAHDVVWSLRPKLDDALYQTLLGSRGRWRAVQTACPARGDSYAEVVVTLA
jgi:hypothetical protein